MGVHYDLHTHSTASDGTLTPTELLTRAAASGVETLALTDHDTLAGLDEAADEAARLGIGFIPGVEVSVTWKARTVHIVGLHIDPACPALNAGLDRLRAYRDRRAEEIGRRLAEAGVNGALAGARALSNGRLVSRTHFARYLVSQGHAETVRDVFKRYLVRGRPGHVEGDWAGLEEAVGWIRAAGGQAVVAHPARYGLTRTKLRELLQAFVAAGGEGIEVISGSHTRDEEFTIARHAQDFGLLASAGSDYHGPENPWIELGGLPELPHGCRPIWSEWPLAA
jgi:predicted metal-dependent phosphoesterase TrpH